MLNGGFNVIAAPVGTLLVEIMPFEHISMIESRAAIGLV